MGHAGNCRNKDEEASNKKEQRQHIRKAENQMIGNHSRKEAITQRNAQKNSTWEAKIVRGHHHPDRYAKSKKPKWMINLNDRKTKLTSKAFKGWNRWNRWNWNF